MLGVPIENRYNNKAALGTAFYTNEQINQTKTRSLIYEDTCAS